MSVNSSVQDRRLTAGRTARTGRRRRLPWIILLVVVGLIVAGVIAWRTLER